MVATLMPTTESGCLDATRGTGQVYHGPARAWRVRQCAPQYLVQFTTAKRLNGVRAAVNDQTHWEPIYGSIAQARAYVTKEATRIDGPWEYGQIAASGKRRGYDEAVDAVMQGTPLQRVAQEFPGIWVAHGRGLVDLRKQLGLDADRRSFGPEGPEVWVLWGPSGTGKSRFVAKRWPKSVLEVS